MLHKVGISSATVNLASWNPTQKNASYSRPNRAAALRKAHQAAAHNVWLEEELQAALADPRPNMPHQEVMRILDAELSALL